MEEYYNTKEFRKLLRRYQKARRTGVSDYFMASELGDIIQYYAVQGKNDKAMEVSDFTLNLYPGAVEPLAFKARYALSVEDDPDQAQAYADLVEDKTDVEYYYLVAEILIHKEEIGTMENYLRARYAELSKKDKDEFALDVAQMMDDYRLTELALSWLDLVKDRKHPDYKSIKGKVLVFSGLHDVDGEGERLLEELTNDEPYNVDRWLDLAQAQKSKQHNKECVESCDYAIAIDPQNAKAIYLKGGALVAMEHYEEALEALQEQQRPAQEGDRWSLVPDRGHLSHGSGSRRGVLPVARRCDLDVQGPIDVLHGNLLLFRRHEVSSAPLPAAQARLRPAGQEQQALPGPTWP